MPLDTKVRSEDLFGQLNTEDEQSRDKRFAIKKSKGLVDILDSLRIFVRLDERFDIEPNRIYWRNRGDNDKNHVLYLLSKTIIPKKYSSEDITAFSILLFGKRMFDFFGENYITAKLGSYLSALCNQCLQDDIKIFSNLPIDYLGFRNRKNIFVIGNVGDHFAEKMSYGRVVVNGDCHGEVGKGMRGGEININGAIRSDIGSFMKIGRIEVSGNCYGIIGTGMRGGEIHIQGEEKVKLAFDYEAGNIYHQGKQKVKDGKKIGGEAK